MSGADQKPLSSDPLDDVSIEAKIAVHAARHGESLDAIMREVRKRTPAGRFILKLCGIELPEVRRGRPPDEIRFKAIHRVIRDLAFQTKSVTTAFKLAPVELLRMGITGPDGELLTSRSIRRNYKNMPRYWFEDLTKH